MRSALAPYQQIVLAAGRGFVRKGFFWQYLAFFCCTVLTVFGGGVTLDASVQNMLKAGAALFALSLQIAWVFIASGLMALNHPNAARMVPGYVAPLRWTLLLAWVIVCALTGALSAGSWGEWLPGACSAGAVMLLLSTPLRWPFRWVLFIAAFATLARRYPQLTEWMVMRLKPGSPDFRWMLVLALFVGMGWVVTRLIPTGGGAYARVFFRHTYVQPGDFSLKKTQLDPVFAALGARLAQWSHSLNFPLRAYVERLLRAPRPEPGHVLVRAELALGAVHWVTQAGLMLVLLGIASMALVTGSWLSGTALRQLLMEHAALIAGLLLLIAMLPVVALHAVMLTSGVEQCLLLLVPGMPRGAVLNRLLALRHLRQGLLGWSLAALVAVNLPYRGFDAVFAGSLYVMGLLCVPTVIVDWSRIEEPSVGRAIGWLVASAAPPVVSFVAMHRFNVSGLAVGLITLAIWSTLMTYRWRRLAHFPQALPAGRLASSRP